MSTQGSEACEEIKVKCTTSTKIIDGISIKDDISFFECHSIKKTTYKYSCEFVTRQVP